MIYHQIDFFIILEIFNSYKKKEMISSWEIAKKYYKDEWEKSNDHIRRNKCNKVRDRLKRMEEEGLILITENGNKKIYNLIAENVFIKKIKINNEYRNFLFLKEINSKLQGFEI